MNFTLKNVKKSDLKLLKAILLKDARGEVTKEQESENPYRYSVVEFSVNNDELKAVNDDIVKQGKFSDEFQYIPMQGNEDSIDNERTLRTKHNIDYAESQLEVFENIETNVSIAVKRLDAGKMPSGLNKPRKKEDAIKGCDSIRLYQDGLTEYSYIHYDDSVSHQAVGPVRDPRADRKVIEDEWGEKSANKYMNSHHPEFNDRRQKVVGTSRHNAEWLHSIANSLGGPLVSWNMAAGSHAANTQMAVIENAIARQPNISVMVTTYKKKNTQIGMWYTYDVIAEDKHGKKMSRIRFEIDAQRDWYNEKDYAEDNQAINDFLKATQDIRYESPKDLFGHKVPIIAAINYQDHKDKDKHLIGKRPSLQKSSYIANPLNNRREARFDYTSTQANSSPVRDNFANDRAMEDYRIIRNIMKIHKNIINENSAEAIRILNEMEYGNYLSYAVCRGETLLIAAIKMKDLAVFNALLPKVDVHHCSYSRKTAADYIDEMQDGKLKKSFELALANDLGETKFDEFRMSFSQSTSEESEHDIIETQKAPGLLTIDQQFYLLERNSQQQGWNCGDVALALTRQQILDKLVKNSKDPILRRLLSDEIKNAACNTHASDGSNEQNGLPANMKHKNRNALMVAIVNYIQAVAVADPIILEISTELFPYMEDPVSFEMLKVFFQDDNIELYPEAYNKFLNLCVIYAPCVDELVKLTSSEEVYLDYVKNFFDPDKENWLAFQPTAGGTNIFDALAYIDKKQIKIWQANDMNELNVIHQTKQHGTTNSVLNILYNGRHFVALAPNPVYVKSPAISAPQVLPVPKEKAKTEVKIVDVLPKPVAPSFSMPTGKKVIINKTKFILPKEPTQKKNSDRKPVKLSGKYCSLFQEIKSPIPAQQVAAKKPVKQNTSYITSALLGPAPKVKKHPGMVDSIDQQPNKRKNSFQDPGHRVEKVKKTADTLTTKSRGQIFGDKSTTGVSHQSQSKGNTNLKKINPPSGPEVVMSERAKEESNFTRKPF
jgi:hypothetical protein